MKARIPKNFGGQGNMQGMLGQLQKAQDQLAKKQEELDEASYTGEAGGGMVKAVITGKKVLTALSIDPKLIDPDDAEFLADAIMAAINEAGRICDETSAAELGKITGGLKIPGVL